MNLHIVSRPIFLVRAPHPDGAVEDGNWQIQGNEPAFPNVLTNVISDGDGSGDVLARQQPERKPIVPVVQFADDRKSTLHVLGEVCLHVQRSGDARTPCSVHYQTVDGTGRAGKHYTHIQGEIHFAVNQTRQELKVPVGDPMADGNDREKTFYVSLHARAHTHTQCRAVEF